LTGLSSIPRCPPEPSQDLCFRFLAHVWPTAGWWRFGLTGTLRFQPRPTTVRSDNHVSPAMALGRDSEEAAAGAVGVGSPSPGLAPRSPPTSTPGTTARTPASATPPAPRSQLLGAATPRLLQTARPTCPRATGRVQQWCRKCGRCSDRSSSFHFDPYVVWMRSHRGRPCRRLRR